MASFDTPLYTSETGSAGSSAAAAYPLAKRSAGKIRYKVIPYTVDGAETSADTINLGKLKVGAQVIPQLCKVSSQAAFDVDDLDIGTAANADAFADGIDTTNAAADTLFTGGDDHYDPQSIVAGDEDIIATLNNVVTTTAGQLVLFLIAFVDE